MSIFLRFPRFAWTHACFWVAQCAFSAQVLLAQSANGCFLAQFDNTIATEYMYHCLLQFTHWFSHSHSWYSASITCSLQWSSLSSPLYSFATRCDNQICVATPLSACSSAWPVPFVCGHACEFRQVCALVLPPALCHETLSVSISDSFASSKYSQGSDICNLRRNCYFGYWEELSLFQLLECLVCWNEYGSSTSDCSGRGWTR